jgi:hypothetical protein
LLQFERNRTSTIVVMYSLYLYFLGLSLRNTSKALVIFRYKNKRSYVSVWNWIQRFGSCQNYKRKRVSAFIIDETVIEPVTSISGYGYVLSQFIVQCLESIYLSFKRKKHVCSREFHQILGREIWQTHCLYRMMVHRIHNKPVLLYI